MLEQATTHDFSHRGLGHDYFISDVIDGGKMLKGGGWGRGIRSGDFLILPNKGGLTRYKVIDVRYMSDPPDQWFATLLFAPQDTPQQQEATDVAQ